MSTATLMTHAGGKLITYDALAALPVPPAMGSRHRPIAHHALVDAIRNEVAQGNMYSIVREQLAVNPMGSQLFGVMDLAPVNRSIEALAEGAGVSLGFRASNDQSFGLQLVAGARVFVCDNLALSGDLIALQRKHTIGLELSTEITAGFSRFVDQQGTLRAHLAKLQSIELTDDRARLQIFEAFYQEIVPVRLFDDVTAAYFKPSEAMTDCHPRSMYGLHNAFTRALQSLRPTVAFDANVKLGRLFGLTAGAPLQLES